MKPHKVSTWTMTTLHEDMFLKHAIDRSYSLINELVGKITSFLHCLVAINMQLNCLEYNFVCYVIKDIYFLFYICI